MVETDGHGPTEVSLWWDSLRSWLGGLRDAPAGDGIRGWRQAKPWRRALKQRFHGVRRSRQAQASPGRVAESLPLGRDLMGRAKTPQSELEALGADPALLERIQGFLEGAERLSDPIDRRRLPGETMPSHEPLDSVFDPHPRWNVKGKAGRPVERGGPGVPSGRPVWVDAAPRSDVG